MRITLELSQAGLRRAQRELEAYRHTLDERLELFTQKLAQKGLDIASMRFANAEYPGANDVTVRMEQDGTSATIIADGQAVAFIEFGTGVAYPEHPSGLYPHGTYGKGHGADPEGWVYYGEQGSGEPAVGLDGQVIPNLYHTRGNPPAEAMWNAVEEMAASVESVWREVMA